MSDDPLGTLMIMKPPTFGSAAVTLGSAASNERPMNIRQVRRVFRAFMETEVGFAWGRISDSQKQEAYPASLRISRVQAESACLPRPPFLIHSRHSMKRVLLFLVAGL